ncbi:MAG: phage gp6-like head-tail connector protein [Bacteriovoracaceae bacterium]|nr:phage gp6-like head-tail connector protein [Bacteriovoracaceae bacterium]
MLVTLDQMKAYLNIDLADTNHDAFLQEQIVIVSEAIEGYCGRVFSEGTYTQIFHVDEFNNALGDKLTAFHYPVISVTSVTAQPDSLVIPPTEYRIQKTKGLLTRVLNGSRRSWAQGATSFEVVYTAGFVIIPAVIRQVVYSLVSANHNKQQAGISLDFGNDVQSISIPGTLTVNFDYTLQANDRSTAFGMIIGQYSNTLDPFRSERTILGSVEEHYVE